jgi:D-alanyl-D-alanine carboxypeptidase
MTSAAYQRQKALQRAKDQTRRKRISTPLLAFITCACAIGIFLVASLGPGNFTPQGMKPDAPGTAQQTLAPDAGRGIAGTGQSYGGNIGEDTAAPPLLVSASHPLPVDYPMPKLVSLVGKTDVVDDSILIATEIEQPLIDMLADARTSGMDGITVNSGYRSREEQAVLYEATNDKSYVQPPGASEHETGLAVDLLIPDDRSQQWLMDHAWNYGFIVRYPAGKEAITGISSEPWHFRYVGRTVAQQCYENDLCLEEWFDLALPQGSASPQNGG